MLLITKSTCAIIILIIIGSVTVHECRTIHHHCKNNTATPRQLSYKLRTGSGLIGIGKGIAKAGVSVVEKIANMLLGIMGHGQDPPIIEFHHPPKQQIPNRDGSIIFVPAGEILVPKGSIPYNKYVK